MKLPRKTPAAQWLPAFSLVVIGVALLAGKQTPDSTAPLVNLNVTAVDSHGQPVADLRAEDFRIFDNGTPRKVEQLRPVPREGLAPAATFILIDLLNADFTARGLSENEVVHALEHLDSGDNVYLYLLTTAATIYPVHGVASPHDSQWTRQAKPLLDDALRQVNRLKTGNDLYASLRIEPTWRALAGLASQIAEVPGPKSLVWITQGVENGFFQPSHQFVRNTAPLRDFAGNLNSLETAIYTVQQRPSGTLELGSEVSPGDTLNQLSALTGGRSYLTDETEKAIAQAMSTTPLMNYQMAFSPDRVDGKYHKIRVASLRKDVKIQTAQSYYASTTGR
jgi:VWFA-related protein